MNRPCTCHPNDNPPKPCAKKYALSECEKDRKIRNGLSWVRAALDCKTWDWDDDQRECAELELAAALEALK